MTAATQPELGGMALADLETLVQKLGQPRYRAAQIRENAWHGRGSSFAEMRMLPGTLRRALADQVGFISLSQTASSTSDRGLTSKLLLRCFDGQEIETVLIRHPGGNGQRPRNTVCVSSQVGCAIGCVFCATGQLGLRRNLTAAEIVDQVRQAATAWNAEGAGMPTHVVFMGMGEPLHNYEAVAKSIRLLSEWGIAARHIVVSTSGLVPEIDRLAGEGLPVRLAISLHAATDSVRDRLVPLNRKYPLKELKAAARRFMAQTGRRVSLEYVLIAGMNCGPEDAEALRKIAAEVHGHVNLIPMNPIPLSDLRAPSEEACRDFAAQVGPRATIRFSRGARADAACGQLRANMQPLARRIRPVPAGRRPGA